MGKRSDFIRVERDFYPTPRAAVEPLLPHLPESFTYAEPCAGDGALIAHLNAGSGGRCVWASDIEPRGPGIEKYGVGRIPASGLAAADLIITNPPWDRAFLHDFIEWASRLAPAWLLFDADWMHTKQAAYYVPWCTKIVSVGRVKWFPESKNTGKDNCCWYLFDPGNSNPPRFYGR